MLLFNPRVIVGSIRRTTNITALPAPPSVAANSEPEYDEAGRLYVSRFKKSVPKRPVIDRDRIFEFAKKRRRTVDDPPRWQPLLPTEDTRRYLRDLRNAANFYEDVRDLQTHAEIRIVRGFVEATTPRLRAG